MAVLHTLRHLVALSISVTALLCLFGTTRCLAQTPDELEAKLKAGFLINFARYIEWPSNSFVSSNSPIVIGVLGQETVMHFLDEMIGGKAIDSHPVEIKRARRAADLATCHIVFIGTSERERLRPAFNSLRGKPILTVSDMDGFIEANGMIHLKKKQGTMRFDINREAAEQVGLKISSKLLKLADNYRQ